MHKFVSKFRLILVLVLALCCLVTVGCDYAASDGAWDDGPPPSSSDGGGAMNRPPLPSPSRPSPSQSGSNSVSNSSSNSASDSNSGSNSNSNSGSNSSSKPPHVHEWELEYQQTTRKERRTVEEVVYTCSVCGFATNDQRDADSHANTLHTAGTAHIISQGTEWGSTTVTKFKCNTCNTVFDTQAEWQAHSDSSWPHNWDEGATANYRTVCSIHPDAVLDTGAAIDAHLNGDNGCTVEDLQDVYATPIPCSCGGAIATGADMAAHPITGPACTGCSNVTTSEPVPINVLRCSCGNRFYSTDSANRHVAQAGPGNPPYPYSTDRKNVEKEVTLYERRPTGRTICRVCKWVKTEDDENS